MARQEWTDERLNEFAAAFDGLPEEIAKLSEAVKNFGEETKALRADLRQVRQDVGGEAERLGESISKDLGKLRDELRGENEDLRNDLNALGRHISQIGWALVGTLVAAVIAGVVAVLIAVL
jgi:hypothetical protein